MSILGNIFGPKATPVTIPHNVVKNAVWGQRDRYVQNNDFTDYVFRTLGISRLNHLSANTFMLLSDSSKRFMLEQTHDMEEECGLPASSGAFVTAYVPPLSGRKGLAVLIRDDIPGVSHSQPDKHVVLAFNGYFDRDLINAKTFTFSSILTASFNKQGQVSGLDALLLTPETAKNALDYAKTCINQIARGGPLTAAANLARIWPKTANSLDIQPPNP